MQVNATGLVLIEQRKYLLIKSRSVNVQQRQDFRYARIAQLLLVDGIEDLAELLDFIVRQTHCLKQLQPILTDVIDGFS